MGYRIEYTDGEKKTPSCWRMTGILLLLSGLLVSCLYPRGQEVLEMIFWPGDKAQTVAALETMTEELEAGKPIGEAIEGFCREILDGETLALS